jgi:hypothetical protein
LYCVSMVGRKNTNANILYIRGTHEKRIKQVCSVAEGGI